MTITITNITFHRTPPAGEPGRCYAAVTLENTGETDEAGLICMRAADGTVLSRTPFLTLRVGDEGKYPIDWTREASEATDVEFGISLTPDPDTWGNSWTIE